MGAFQSGLGVGAAAAHQQQQFAEANRIAGRNAQAALIENALNNPATAPADRENLLQQHAALFQPHEAPDLFQRLSGLIHGQKTAAGPAGADQSQQPVAPPEPPPKDLLGIPITNPDTAAAHAEPMHPMQTDHPIIGRFHEALDALGNHLKGAVQPVAPNPEVAQNNQDVLAKNYVSPETIKRADVATAAQNAQALWGTRGETAVDVAKIRQGGSSGLARYQRAFAAERNKDLGDLTPDEMQQATREFGEANRRPQVIIDKRNGVANIVTRDEDGQAIANPMRDEDGQLFDGFQPDKVTIRGTHYQFVGADNVVHSVPITNVTKTIFGPHVQGEPGSEKPLVLHKPDEKAISPTIAPGPTTPPDVTAAAAALAAPTQPTSSAAPQMPGAPPAGSGASRRGAAIKSAPISANAPQAPGYSGSTLGAAKLNQQDRSTLESDQQIQASIERVLPILEKLKDKNNLGDKATSIMDALGYKAGFAPTDAQGEILKDLAFIKAQGALPLMRLGRNRKTVEDIQQHLPSATDTPARLYDNIKWLNDNIIPENVEATKNPTPKGKQPQSSKAPSAPKAQNLTDRLNEALGK